MNSTLDQSVHAITSLPFEGNKVKSRQCLEDIIELEAMILIYFSRGLR
jgi:hypothetical protein